MYITLDNYSMQCMVWEKSSTRNRLYARLSWSLRHLLLQRGLISDRSRAWMAWCVCQSSLDNHKKTSCVLSLLLGSLKTHKQQHEKRK